MAAFQLPFQVDKTVNCVGTPLKDTPQESRPLLFTPIKFRGLTLKNRIVVSPMCQYSSHDGEYNMWHASHYGKFSVGGAGLVIMEATGVMPNGRISPNCLGIWSDKHAELMRPTVEFIHTQGGAVGIQLAHAGRKASDLPPFVSMKREDYPGIFPDDVWGASPIPFSDNWYVPKEMTIDDINTVKKAFVDAAVRADKVGFDVIEIHAAHGYLLSSFLSPLSNQRTDQYGGSFENRTRLLFETIEEISKVWPETKPLFVRVSSTEWVEGGWSLEDTVKLGIELKRRGRVDLLDCSSGGNNAAQKINVTGWGYQVPFSREVRTRVPEFATSAVGLIAEPWQAERVLESGAADLVMMGTQFLREPNWPHRAARELGFPMHWAPQYERGRARM